MNVLVTGATGFIGKHLIFKLAEGGFKVKALYRNESKINLNLHDNIEWVKGDITNAKHLAQLTQHCDIIFHLAAYAKVWAPRRDTFRQINYLGTKNILDAAVFNKVKKVIITSTAGVFGPSDGSSVVDENTVRTKKYFSEYEQTKDAADSLILNDYAGKLPVCIVCPTRVFGPGELSVSNSVTRLIDLYVRGKFHFLPGNGLAIGNYVYIDDVINGMLLTLAHGKSGERYILGGENLSYQEFFKNISEISKTRHKLYKIPVFIIILTASIMKILALLFKIPPTLTPGWARKYLYDWNVSSTKAETELAYKPIPVKMALRKTLVWILSVQNSKTN